jgi:hypothetical protein
MKSFNEFINEGKVFYGSKFFEIVKKLKDSNKIAEYLYRIQGKEYDKMKIGIIGFSDNDKTLKFKPFDKLKGKLDYMGIEGDDDISIASYPPTESKRAFKDIDDIIDTTKDKAKIGRLVRKVLTGAGIDIKNQSIEEFVNILKTEFKTINNEFKNFELVSGDDINKYYLCENYSKEGKGTLGNSCMRQSYRNRFMDFYTLNPQSVNLLIYKDPNEEDKILGRALVWFNAENVNSNEKTTFMDRVYYTYDSDKKLFEKYAEEKGWDHLGYTDPNHKIKVKPGRYKKYPYLDSFSYYNFIDGYLTSEDDLFDNNHVVSLQNINGGYDCYECDGNFEEDCYECDGNGEFDCDECDGSRNQDCDECDTGIIECDGCNGEGTKECSQTGCQRHHNQPLVN